MASNFTVSRLFTVVRFPTFQKQLHTCFTRNLSTSRVLLTKKDDDGVSKNLPTTTAKSRDQPTTTTESRDLPTQDTESQDLPGPEKEKKNPANYQIIYKDYMGHPEVQPPPEMDPFHRIARAMKHDMKSLYKEMEPLEPPVRHVDIVIIGGGVMGSSIAYFMKERLPKKGLSVMVIEKDPGYTRCSTVLSMGGVRQQFSLPENVEMSMFGSEFLRNAHKHLAVEDSAGPDMHFHPQGYLFLASENGAEQLVRNKQMQETLGAKVELLSPTKLKEKFPWINTDGVAVATHGLENEGWFDPWSLLYGFKRKAIAMEVEYVQGEVIGFDFEPQHNITFSGEDHPTHVVDKLDKVIYKAPDGELKLVKFAFVINAAGHESGKVASMARIGRGKYLLSVPLPVEPRKRFVYFYHAPDPTGPGLDCPLVIDTSGAYFRREGLANYFLGGQSPELDEEPNTETLDVDYGYFDNTVWPNLAHRVPAFNNIKMKSAWAGYYDYNSFDQNAIIGPHPYHTNMYFACGFSGHGIQQAAAVGRATAEMILDGYFRKIDLNRFLFDRLIVGRQVKEENIV